MRPHFVGRQTSIKDGITFDDNSIADLSNGDYDEKHEKYDGFKSFDKLYQAIEGIEDTSSSLESV